MYYSYNRFFIFSVIFVKSVFSHLKCSENPSITIFNHDYTERNETYLSGVDKICSKQKLMIDNTKTGERSFRSVTKENITRTIAETVPWYLRVPLLPILFATSPTLPEGKCKTQVRRYLNDLNNGILWAVRMFDSSTKYPEGIIIGQTRHYGNFDECYQIKTIVNNISSDEEVEVIGGKYCLVKVEYHEINSSNTRVKSHILDMDPNGSVWESIKEKGDFRRVKRYLLELALCVPDSCSKENIEEALNEPLRRLGIEQGLSIKSEVKGQCQTQKDSPKFSSWAIIFCCAILGIFLIVVFSTWYDLALKDVEEETESLFVDILLCFSARRNFKSITEITYTHPGLDSISFFRFIFMCCSIFGHRLMQYYTNPIINSEYMEYSYTEPLFIFVYNGPIIVECFFTFGGILLAYSVLAELDKKKKINFIGAILIRYLRFTPSYLFVIIFIALILPHMGSGPYWEYKIGLETSSCTNNWWANLLYINNYVNTDKLCMFQSWYITVDYHLYIIALFVVYIFWKIPRSFGYPFLVSIIIIGCAIPFYLTYFYDVEPMYRGLPYMHEVREDPYFTDHYIKTHERIAPYFIGVLGGAIIYDHSLSPWSIPKPLARLPLMLFAFLVSIKSQSIGWKFYDPNMSTTSLENALYAGLSRPVFALGMVCIIVIMSVSDSSEFHHKIFKPRWVQPVARLTYGVYLIHNINQSYDIGVARNAKMFSIHNAIWDLVPDVVFSFLLSLILSLLIEGPFRRMEKRLITKRTSKQRSIGIANSTLRKKSD